ncbi:hypothetical protein M5X66_10505 [Providencia sp. PROV188]|uniref:Uncharacterized protein n=1 Tax=Providencia alcalifaciens TaxID=126385 RepID=A0A4R3NPQ5_9GAMM|nr:MULTISPECIES: hypothetical protein [Providencia]ETT00069.1 hypothetical protein HMPREF1568_0229 [Providencia alcalifaciens PAL-3]EUD00634.1 hypothetical protein HMPREF1566_2818 [Providencia alcalifaciens PAL-1]MTC40803.1 hypothetical protein [Providencia sp. wls1921]TCT36726.1 hypothetical protein EC835_102177 [Providencia alcalifaciens]WBM59439.1 hypothetical protein M5X66_10505 [Providencia sp. PROV188]
MALYVYCSLSNDQHYSVDEGQIFIAGQANVMTEFPYTSIGRMTTISDEQFVQLKNNSVFQLHKKNGFIRVEHHQDVIQRNSPATNASDELSLNKSNLSKVTTQKTSRTSKKG